MALAIAVSGDALAQGMGIGVGIDDILPRGAGTNTGLCGIILTGGTNLLTTGTRLSTGCLQRSGPLLTIGVNLSTTGLDLTAQ